MHRITGYWQIIQCSEVQFIEIYFSVLKYSSVYWNIYQCIYIQFSVLKYSWVYFNTLNCIKVKFSEFKYISVFLLDPQHTSPWPPKQPSLTQRVFFWVEKRQTFVRKRSNCCLVITKYLIIFICFCSQKLVFNLGILQVNSMHLYFCISHYWKC